MGRTLLAVGVGMLVDSVDSFVGGCGLWMGLLVVERIGGSLTRRTAGCQLPFGDFWREGVTHRD